MAGSAVPGARTIAVHHDLFPSPALRGAVRATTRRADVVVAASQAIADELRLPATILHPGVDLEAFTPTPLPDGPPRALIAGALVPWKRPDLAVEIARKMPDVHFTFGGEPLPGDPMPELDAPDNVTFAGRVDMHAALAEHHVLLHCADREPWGLVLIEALAAGRPRPPRAARWRSSTAASTRPETRTPPSRIFATRSRTPVSPGGEPSTSATAWPA